MAFLCPARVRKTRKKRGRRDPQPPLPGRITGSASIDTLVRVGLEKEELIDGRERQQMVVLHDFEPCVEDELAVKRGETVTILYQENDWVYVMAGEKREGFIPFVYCVPMGRNIDDLHASRRQQKKFPRLNNNNTLTYDRTSETYREYRDFGDQGEGTYSVGASLNRKASQSLTSVNTTEVPDVTEQETDPGTALVDVEISENRPTPKRENEKTGYDNAALESVINNVATIEVVGVKSFHKEAAGRFIVLFSYRVQEEGDLDVNRGDFVTVLNKDDEDWYWVARPDGHEGFVPSNFLCPAEGNTVTVPLEQQTATSTGSSAGSICSQNVQQVAPTSSSGNQTVEMVVLYDYTAQAPDDVTVTRGEWVNVNLVDQPEEGWYWVYAPATNKCGFIPKEFAKPPAIVRNTTTRRSTVEHTPQRSGVRVATIRRTMSMHERRNTTAFDPYLSP